MPEPNFKIKLLNKLIAVENVMCIYRNFWTLSKRAKVFVGIKAAIASMVHVASFLHFSNFIFTRPYYDSKMLLAYEFTYNMLTTALTLLNIIVGISQSLKFQRIIPKINSVHEFCKKGRVYPRELNKLTLRSCINCIIIFTANFVILAAIIVKSKKNLDDTHSYIVVAGQTVLKAWREIQFYVELLTFNILITITAAALNQMKENLMELLKMFEENNEDDSIESGRVDLKLLQEFLIKTVEAYDCLKESTIKMQQCFGIQMVFSLLSLSLFYIFLSYRGITSIMKLATELRGHPHHAIIIVRLIIYMGAIISVLRAGQLSHNAMGDLRRFTAKLHNKLLRVPDPDADAVQLRKLVKAFLRQMTFEPVGVTIMSQLPVQMALLPQILTVIISYTIIFLQFNHVV